MAGDTKETSATQLAVPETDAFAGIQSTLDAIRDELRGSISDGPGIFDILASGAIASATHQWQRLRVERIIATCSTAGTLIITVGSRARTLNLAVGVSDIPFPDTIERGTNVDLSGTAVGVTAYLIATPE
jgi:hypothetical protein